jgi:hypothetical protein
MLSKARVLRILRTALISGVTYTEAWKKAGIKSTRTLYTWRKKDARIDRYIKACMEMRDEKQVNVVEDAYFNKLASGNGSGSEYEHYLSNRCPERWKSKNALVNVGVNVAAENAAISTPHAVIFSAVKDECQTPRP